MAYAAVGVTATLCSCNVLSGILKARYSDFIVREVASDGSVVRLTRTWPHALPGAAPAGAGAPEASAQQLELLLGAALLAAVQSLLRDSAGAPLRVPAPASKEARGRVHAALRALSGGALLSNYEAPAGGEDGPGCIFIERVRGGSGGGERGTKRQRGAGGGDGGGWRGSWDPATPPFTRFVLQKSNVDTASALRQLAENLGLHGKRFGYAGAKDKRGVTTQHVTVFRCEPERVARAAARDRRVAVGDFALVARALHLGELRGNRFTVTMRDVRAGGAREPAEAAARAAVAAWAAAGFRFVSFFGLQRFGGTALGGGGGGVGGSGDGDENGPAPSDGAASAPAMRTHLVGRALLRGEWAEALALVLAPRDGDAPVPAAALAEALVGGCSIGAALPRIEGGAFLVHRKLLSAAAALLRRGGGGGGGSGDGGGKGGDEGGGAPLLLTQLTRGQALEVLATLPPQARALYVHAYQSYLWNTLASARAGAGCDVVAGDVVIEAASDDGDEGADEAAAVAAAEEEVEAAGAAEGAAAGVAQPAPLPAVRVATEDDAAAGRFPAAAIALPVPGAEVAVFPGNARWGLPALGALLRADGFPVPPGGGEDAAAAVRAVFHPRDRRFYFAGGYRRLLGHAERVSWALLRYGDPLQELAEACGGEGGAVAGGEAAGEGAFLALQLSFTLKKSCYATVALRELLQDS
jgi:tRNA pseudouridine13 synthase